MKNIPSQADIDYKSFQMTHGRTIEIFDELAGRLTHLFAQMRRDHGLPRTVPELSAICLAFFIVKTVLHAKPFGHKCWGEARCVAMDWTIGSRNFKLLLKALAGN